MGISTYIPSTGAGGGPSSVLAFTQSQVALAPPTQLSTPDPTGVNVNSFLSINTSLLSSITGVVFNVTVISNGDRFRFERRDYGGSWTATAAMAMNSGFWDYEHRGYESGGIWSWAVPALGAIDMRIVRLAGTAGANTCVAGAAAHHGAFPSPPKYVGKRDVTLMVKSFSLPTALSLAPFDVTQENDDRTRTLTTGVNTRAVRTGRRFWVQGYDVGYQPSSGTDRARVVLLSRPNGAVATNSDPKLEVLLASTTGRAVTLPEPLEFQAALGAGQMNVGIGALSTVGFGVLSMTVFGFETP